MNKKKSLIVLIIISSLLFFSSFFLALLSWVRGIYFSYNSILATVGIPGLLINVIFLIWFIYFVVLVVKGSKRISHIAIAFILMILLIISSIQFYNVVNRNHIEYHDLRQTYHVYQIGNKVEVYYNSNIFLMCDPNPCRENRTIEKINFSSEKMRNVNDFIKDLFKDKKSNNIVIYSDDLSNTQNRVMQAIIKNNEKYLDNFTDKELYFTLQSHVIKCPTVLLRVYKVNTYEYIDGDNVLIGDFSYDVSKIIENSENYSPNSNGIYELITEENYNISLYDNNVELNEFLSEINVNLNVCEKARIVD